VSSVERSAPHSIELRNPGLIQIPSNRLSALAVPNISGSFVAAWHPVLWHSVTEGDELPAHAFEEAALVQLVVDTGVQKLIGFAPPRPRICFRSLR